MSALRSASGRLLYRQLPEEYRYRDNTAKDEIGDLAAYLDGFGDFLDAIRATLEQLYADAFAEPVDLPDPSGAPNATRQLESQGWTAPYLADLIGAELIGPTPEVRRLELDNAIAWFKAKGTVGVVDGIADLLIGSQAMLVEDWQRSARTPRVSQPTSLTGSRAETRAAFVATPDLQRPDRAVIDDAEKNPLRRLPDAEPPLFWRPLHPGGAPWFPGSYQDTARRTPDVRTGVGVGAGPHPERTHVYVRPPWGLFEPDLPELAWPPFAAIAAFDVVPHLDAFATPLPPALEARLREGEAGLVVLTPEVAWLLAGNALDAGFPAGRRFRMTGHLELPAGHEVHILHLLAVDDINVASGATLALETAAAGFLSLGSPPEDGPILTARNSLLGAIGGVDSFVALEYCTVLGRTDVVRLNASDCIFGDRVPRADCHPDDAGKASCVRFSRLPPPVDETEESCARRPTNTSATPRFARFFAERDGRCSLHTPAFGESGCGVLSDEAPGSVAAGAETGGEMGAHHAFAHAARLDAVRRKLADFVPFGMDLVVGYDPHLALRPPVATL